MRVWALHLLLAELTTVTALHASPSMAAALRARLPTTCRAAAMVEPTQPVVQRIRGKDDHREAVAEDKLVVIKYFAPWCRMCKAIGPKYERVAKGMQEASFFEVSFDEAKALCKQQGILSLPTVHVFAKGEKLAETSLTVNGIKRFEQELAKLALEQAGSYVARNTCDDNFWVCASDCDELTFVSYAEPDGGA